MKYSNISVNFLFLCFLQRNWNVVDNMFTFQREERVDDTIPAADLAEKTIEYARELEMIVWLFRALVDYFLDSDATLFDGRFSFVSEDMLNDAVSGDVVRSKTIIILMTCVKSCSLDYKIICLYVVKSGLFLCDSCLYVFPGRDPWLQHFYLEVQRQKLNYRWRGFQIPVSLP